jgi:ankyrin repeat protein
MNYWTEVLFEALLDQNVSAFCEAVQKGGDIRAFSERGETILSVAVGGDERMLRLAVDLGADPNQPDAEGYSPLRHATLSRKSEALKLLIEGGAAVDAETPSDGSTSLHVAAENCFEQGLSLLLTTACGQKLNSFDYVNRTPLICAVQKGCLPSAKILISAGADVNARDSVHLWDTALAFAVESIDVDMVSLLMDAGADPNSKGFMQDTPLCKAQRLSSPKRNEILRLLSRRSGSATTGK